MAHHLLDPLGGASARYHIALARLHMQKNQLAEAEQNLNAAVQVDFQVISLFDFLILETTNPLADLNKSKLVINLLDNINFGLTGVTIY